MGTEWKDSPDAPGIWEEHSGGKFVREFPVKDTIFGLMFQSFRGTWRTVCSLDPSRGARYYGPIPEGTKEGTNA